MNIISQEPLYVLADNFWTRYAKLIELGIPILLVLIFFLIGLKKRQFYVLMVGSLIGIALEVVFIYFCEVDNKVPIENKYKYECTFDNTYTVNELFKNYNVISYKDGIFIIEDKMDVKET